MALGVGVHRSCSLPFKISMFRASGEGPFAPLFTHNKGGSNVTLWPRALGLAALLPCGSINVFDFFIGMFPVSTGSASLAFS